MNHRQTPARKIRYFLEYLLFLFLNRALGNLSSQSVYRLGQLFGKLAYRLGGKRLDIARTNLNIAFGDRKSAAEKNRILKQSVTQMVVSALQFLWVSRDTQNRVHQLIPEEPEGLDVLRECRERGKGIFFLTAHYGNWEVMGIRHGFLDAIPLHSIARKLDNPYLEKFVMKMRTSSGNGIFHREESPIKMVRAAKRNEAVAVMMDQNAGIFALFVDFFGLKAATPRSLALLSYSTGAPIVPMFCYPQGDGTYRVEYGPALSLEKTGNKEEDVIRWTRECLSFLEGVIEKQPFPWMWIHRRWKSRPLDQQDQTIY